MRGAQYGVFRRTIECSTIRCDRFILPREKAENGADSFDRGRWYSLPCRHRPNNRYDRNMGDSVKLCERLQLCGAANRGLLRATDPEALQDSGGTGDFQVNSAALPRSRRKADRSQRRTHNDASDPCSTGRKTTAVRCLPSPSEFTLNAIRRKAAQPISVKRAFCPGSQLVLKSRGAVIPDDELLSGSAFRVSGVVGRDRDPHDRRRRRLLRHFQIARGRLTVRGTAPAVAEPPAMSRPACASLHPGHRPHPEKWPATSDQAVRQPPEILLQLAKCGS